MDQKGSPVLLASAVLKDQQVKNWRRAAGCCKPFRIIPTRLISSLQASKAPQDLKARAVFPAFAAMTAKLVYQEDRGPRVLVEPRAQLALTVVPANAV